jgi:spore photoproduct lyase
MKRHKSTGLDVASNTNDILTAINSHVMFADVEKPNQTHEHYITYDISCNEDFALHAKYHQWKDIFEFFKQHDRAMGSFATKYVNENLLEYNPNGKIRIRFSLMPQSYSSILEPNTSLIIDRIKAIDRFIDAGYDVHINFSPVIVTHRWLEEYQHLFQLVNDNVINKDKVKCEVIFLTHEKKKHEYNVKHNLPGENLIWNPEIQVDKVSQYGGENIRYVDKYIYVDKFKELHNEIIPWNLIRYIF